jgi:RNA polymerase sigma-70 factor (ECF subfamily)
VLNDRRPREFPTLTNLNRQPASRRTYDVRNSLVVDEARWSAHRHDRSDGVPSPEASDAAAPRQSSDADLARRLGEADADALAQLYQRFGKPCYSLARRICADEGLAEDVVQEVFLALWRDPGRFDPARGTFATWLLTLIHHKAVDAVRRESTIRRRVVPAPEAGEDWSPSPMPGADQAAMARVAAGQVRQALHLLPVEQRQVLALAYYGGHTQREIAALTGVPLGTVKSRMFAGVQRLRSALDEQLNPDSLLEEARRAGEVRR